MRHQDQGIWRHYLGNGPSLNLVESEADGHAPVIKPASTREDIPQRDDRSVWVAVFDQKPRLLARLSTRDGSFDVFSIGNGIDDLCLAIAGHPVTHAKLEVVGAQALVGSSNFTRPGLTRNIELNVQIQSGREVAQLQEWFEIQRNRASDVTEAVIETISRHTHLYSPFDVYAQSGQNRCPRRWNRTVALLPPVRSARQRGTIKDRVHADGHTHQ